MGQGWTALWLAEQGWDVTGIDIPDEGVAQAWAEAGRRGLRLKAERVRYAELPMGRCSGAWLCCAISCRLICRRVCCGR